MSRNYTIQIRVDEKELLQLHKFKRTCNNEKSLSAFIREYMINLIKNKELK